MSWSQIAHITSAGPGTGSSGTATSPGQDTTGANIIVIFEDDDGPTQSVSAPTAPTDNKGNTYTAIAGSLSAANDVSSEFFYCASPTVGSGHTWTPQGTQADICVSAWSGAAASPADQSHASTGGSNSIQPGSITPSQDNCLIVTGYSGVAQTGLAYPSGFTGIDKVSYGANGRLGRGHAYQTQTTATAVNPTWTWSTDPFHPADENASVISLKMAAAATFNPGWAYSATRIISGAFQ